MGESGPDRPAREGASGERVILSNACITPVHDRVAAMTHFPTDRTAVPAWWLPGLAALLPFVVSHLAWVLSLQAQLIPACNPYVEGCVSISRAARHGVGNDVFRLVMLPMALLQAACWWTASARLAAGGLGRGRGVAILGVLAGMFLALYANFLGSEGEVYRLLRRNGVTGYFGCTYLCLLLVLRAHSAADPRPPGDSVLRVIAAGFLLTGLVAVGSGYAVDAATHDRLENALEWQLGLWLTALFAAMAWQWRREGLCWHLAPRRT